MESTEKEPARETDWDEILNRALESTDSNSGIVINQQAYDIANSRKKTFLDKLRSPKSAPEDQRNLPDWFFDDNGDLSRNEIESEFGGSGDLSDEVNLDPEEPMESNSSESGVFDIDITPAINDLNELENTNTLWKNDEEVTSQENNPKSGPSLDDTQQVLIPEENPSDLLIDSAKALEGGNTKFAYSTLGKLVSKKQNLHEVSNHLERAIELYPDRPEFRLLLSESYSALGEKEKSLAILQNAQKNITL